MNITHRALSLFVVYLTVSTICVQPAKGAKPDSNKSQVVVPKDSTKSTLLEFTISGMTCQNCATTATGVLNKIPGVTTANVVFDSETGSVLGASTLTRDDIHQALGKLGFEVTFASDSLVPPPLTADERALLDIRLATRGQKFNIKDHLVSGKFTIFDYFARWCGPCLLLTPKLERLVANNDNIALRTVDIVDWKSDAAKQATKKFRIRGLPYVRVYGPDGKFLGEVVGNKIEQVETLINGFSGGS